MKSQFTKAFLIFLFPMLVGFGLGYAVKSSSAQSTSDSVFLEDEIPASSATPVRQSQSSQDLAVSRQNAITRAVAKVSPAVVGINVIEVREYVLRDPFYQFFGDDPFFRRFFGDRTFRQQVKGLGSGFVISPDGYIITNDHVAGNAKEITVTMTNGQRMRAEIVGTDPLSDICLLKVDGNNLPYIPLGNSDDVIVGEWAIALGNPFGLFEINDKPTVTVGVISSTGMNLGRVENRVYRDMIETDAAINGGNSGGPLVNSLGEVIGVNTLIYTGGRTDTYVGYGFAIPINKVKKIVADLRKSGKVDRDVWAGFEAQQVDGRIARYFGLSRAEGIIVSEIQRNSPAEKADLRVGDIILEANGQKITAEGDFIAVISDLKAGDSVNLKIYRERRTMNLTLKLERRPA
ncbi:MAG TPA: trypsin-like peptidase domain-containing protein [Bacteroidota bacterium]|nr:trypsin-like peptidase domain-containing protein [Bacteroidota bacterium]